MKVGKIALMATAGISAAVILGSTTASALTTELYAYASSTSASAYAIGYNPRVHVELSYSDRNESATNSVAEGSVSESLIANGQILASMASAWVDGEQTRFSFWSYH